MSSREQVPAASRYTVMDPAPHSLHECHSVEEFSNRFEAATGCSVQQMTDHVVSPAAPHASFLVGSVPLGMATPGSDIDVIVLVDSREALLDQPTGGLTNTDQLMAFSNESDPLRAVEFLAVINGLMVDVTAVLTSSVKRVYARLRSRGPELSETEILTLGRLRTGWLLWQSEEYLEKNGLTLTDPALDIYCSTKHFVAAQAFMRKSTKALGLRDIPLALHLGRSGVEAGYLAYFASEGFSYLGAKWLAQIGCAHGAADRVRRHPLLQQGAHLLFPSFDSTTDQTAQYLRAVAEFLGSMRSLIEQKTLFRIAFSACPQIKPP